MLLHRKHLDVTISCIKSILRNYVACINKDIFILLRQINVSGVFYVTLTVSGTECCGYQQRKHLSSISLSLCIKMAGPRAVIQVCSTHICMVQCTHLITTGGTPTCIIEGLACWLTLCILEKIIGNFTNSVQISFIQTLKLIDFSWTIWWC